MGDETGRPQKLFCFRRFTIITEESDSKYEYTCGCLLTWIYQYLKKLNIIKIFITILLKINNSQFVPLFVQKDFRCKMTKIAKNISQYY